MDTTQAVGAVDVLASIPIGVIIKWIALVTGVIGAFCAGAIKTYKVFEKYKSIKDEKENLETTVHEHDEKINELSNKIDLVLEKLESQDVTTMKNLRRELVKDGEQYLIDKKMTIRAWRSWMEMYNEYHDKYKQNSYVETLKNKLEREVTIVGKLDEHGNDIE